MIRLAIPADLPSIVAIYNQAIAAQNVTADTVEFTVEQRLGWFQSHRPETYPIYVYEEGGQVLGWLSVSPYRGRSALSRTAEVSYYVDYACHGKGICSALMQHALNDASRIGKKIYLAILLDWNTDSIRLLEKFNFEKWGHLPEVAEFAGKTCGHLYYGRCV